MKQVKTRGMTRVRVPQGRARTTQLSYAKFFFHWQKCRACKIGRIAHRHVLVAGNVPCDVLFLGEAPGKTEDLKGVPFCGRSGEILDYWINQTMKEIPEYPFTHAMTNMIACRPTDELGGPNRVPTQDELDACRPRLDNVLFLCKPQVVVCLGQTAASSCPFESMIQVPHPAYALRKGGKKSDVSERAIKHLTRYLKKHLPKMEDKKCPKYKLVN